MATTLLSRRHFLSTTAKEDNDDDDDDDDATSSTTTTTTTVAPRLFRHHPQQSLSLTTSTSSPLLHHQHYHNNNTHTSASPCCHHQHHQRRYKSVFVSKHNQSLHVTVQDILDVMKHHTTDSSIGTTGSGTTSSSSSSNYHRTTAQHVIFRECPFCSKPSLEKPDNQYKLYVKLGGGAYFCHRCGTGGSWFDFKARLNGNGGGGGGGSNSSSSAGGPFMEDDGDFINTTTTATSSAAPPVLSARQALRQIQSKSKSNYSSSSSSHPSKSTAGLRQFLQQQPPPAVSKHIPCLPMPSPRLQALYSSQLLDQQPQPQPQQPQQSQKHSATTTNNNGSSTTTANNNNNNNTTTNKALQYLLHERGLTLTTLRRYGIGCAEYSFPLSKQQQQQLAVASSSPYQQQHQQQQQQQTIWKTAECITFPWIMTVEDVQYQEELRGASFVYPTTSSSTTTTTTTAATTSTDTNEKKKKKIKDTKSCKDEENIDKSSDTEEEEDKDTNNSTTTSRTFLTRRIKARALENKAWQRLDPAGGGWGLFGYHTIPVGAKELVVTEGEYDAMAVWQATGRPAVSLPNGCRSLPVEVLPLLEEFDKIYLWMDNDAPGQEGAELFAKKVGIERCFLVRPTTQNTGLPHEQDLPKDANDALRQDLDMNTILDDAKVVPHEQILTFQDLRSDVLHEIMYPEKYVGLPIPSLPKFTSLIKGLRRGELTVLTGPTGSGCVYAFSICDSNADTSL